MTAIGNPLIGAPRPSNRAPYNEQRAWMAANGYCTVSVSNGGRSVSVHLCGKQVKEDGLCGQHAGVAKRKAKREAEREARDRQGKRDYNDAMYACAVLAEEFGIHARPEFDGHSFEYTGGIVFNKAGVDLLIEVLRARR